MPFLLLLWGGAQKAFGAVLEFSSKPPGSWIAAAIALALGLWWFGHLRYAAGVSAFTAAAAARAAQAKAKQAAAISGANERADARAIVSAGIDAKSQEVVSDVKKSAAAMPDANGIAITADVADRLRDVK